LAAVCEADAVTKERNAFLVVTVVVLVGGLVLVVAATDVEVVAGTVLVVAGTVLVVEGTVLVVGTVPFSAGPHSRKGWSFVPVRVAN
jgi:hypothetical protein